MARVTAVSSLGWAHYTLYEALPCIAALGFCRVEIGSFFSYSFHFNFGSPRPSELRALLSQHGLEPICLNYCAAFHQAWVPEEIDSFVNEWTRKIEQLNQVGIPMITMDFGIRNERDDQLEQLSNSVKAYERVAKVAARHGVRLLLEVPHLYSIMHRPEQVLWVFDRLESENIGALVDSSHWGIIRYDLEEFFDRLGACLWHVHLRDSRGPDTADMRQELELTPGQGVVDFRRFADALDRIGYGADVCLDFEYRDMTFDAIEREYCLGLKHLMAMGWQLPEAVKSKILSQGT